jgi:RNA polymerase sigma-70 factor, ECF subfamily
MDVLWQGGTVATSQFDSDAFVQLLTEFQSRLYVYILSVVANDRAANDILSDTNATLWQKREEFQIGTSFAAWAFKVAYFRILAYQKKRHSDRHVFSDEFLSEVAEVAAVVSEEISEMRSALSLCLKKLSSADRRLVNMRYESGMSVQHIAGVHHKTPNAISHALFRIRAALTQCIERTMRSEPAV